jgi:hypothetical protein
MISSVSPVSYFRAADRGRTQPLILICERTDESPVEVVAKFSAGCDEREANLAREVLAACLAADLGLPVPEPFIVNVTAEWIATIPDHAHRARVSGSCRAAFGSKLITGQYSAWNPGTILTDAMLPLASSIFLFDAIIQNADRRDENPNCLVNGDQIRIFDHEMAFMHRMILGWKPPWVLGSLHAIEPPGRHIFRTRLAGRAIDFNPVKATWMGITNARVDEYKSSLPDDWKMIAGQSIDSAIALIKDARDNIDGCVAEVMRVLK